jgi:hypothetical protein
VAPMISSTTGATSANSTIACALDRNFTRT